VYDVTSGSLVHKPDDNVHCATFTSSGKQFVLGTMDGQLRMYDSVSGQYIHGVRAHGGAIHHIFTSDYADIVMTTVGGLDSKDRSLRLWRINDYELVLHAVFTPDAKISSMAFAAKGQAIVLEITDIVPFWLISDGDNKPITLKGDLIPDNQANYLKNSFAIDLSDFSLVNDG
jgi:WD40 repeat protein